jgi:nickel superoxide dismutase
MPRLLAALNRILPAEEAHAHCDIPCGIYDPHLAQIGALTCVRMNQLIEALEPPAMEKPARDKYMQQLSRYTETKEEHAELVKKEVRIIWGDFFKPEHLEKAPDLHNTVWNIMKLASTVRQNIDLAAAEKLLDEVNTFAEAFWAAKGVATKRQPSNQAVGGEVVLPA